MNTSAAAGVRFDYASMPFNGSDPATFMLLTRLRSGGLDRDTMPVGHRHKLFRLDGSTSYFAQIDLYNGGSGIKLRTFLQYRNFGAVSIEADPADLGLSEWKDLDDKWLVIALQYLGGSTAHKQFTGIYYPGVGWDTYEDTAGSTLNTLTLSTPTGFDFGWKTGGNANERQPYSDFSRYYQFHDEEWDLDTFDAVCESLISGDVQGSLTDPVDLVAEQRAGSANCAFYGPTRRNRKVAHDDVIYVGDTVITDMILGAYDASAGDIVDITATLYGTGNPVMTDPNDYGWDEPDDLVGVAEMRLPTQTSGSPTAYDFDIAGHSGISVTGITMVSDTTWGRGISLSDTPLYPASLSSTIEATVTPHEHHGNQSVDYEGVGYKEIDIQFTENAVAKNLRMIVGVAQAPASHSFTIPTLAEFKANWIAEWWNMAGTQTTENPSGLSWGAQEGHLNFATTRLVPSIESGVPNQLIWMPFGRVPDSGGNLNVDDYVLMQEQHSDKSHLYDEWDDAMQACIDADPDCIVYCYIGSLDVNDVWTDFITNVDPQGFVERLLASLEPYLKWEHVRICFDDPYGSTIDEGEARYEAYVMVRNILLEKGHKVWLEPRHPAAYTQWNASNGWERVVVDPLWYRTNPAFFSDASSSATDANLGDLILMHPSPGSPSYANAAWLVPYAVADNIWHGAMSVISIRDWIEAGGTVETLYNEVVSLLEAVAGV
jgi:hypothetical protein